ncbi:MAG: Vitamin B12 import ATP-binding protein BtuD [Parabacteroides sp.]
MSNCKSQKPKQGFSRLLEIAGTKRWWLIGSVVLAIGSTLAQFVPYIAILNILNELAAHAANPENVSRELVKHWGIVCLVAFGCYGILLFVSLMCSHIAAFNILYELRVAITRKMAKLPLGFFTKRTTGDLKKIIGEDVERVELFVAHHIPDLTSAIVFPLLIIGWLFTIDWRLALIVLAVMLIAFAFQFSTTWSKKANEDTKSYMSIMGKLNASIIEYVRGMQVVKIFNRSSIALANLKKQIFGFRDFSNTITTNYAVTYLGFYNMLSATLLFIIPVAVYFLLKAPSYSGYISTVLIFLVLGGGIFFPMLKLLWMTNMLRQNSMGVDLMDGILQKEEIADPDDPQTPRDASIEFKSVSFAYDKTQVLDNVSFTAQPGTVTALVGVSGAGKSTIAMLAARFWDIREGEIRIGGSNIKQIRTEDLMNTVSFVFQDNMLFFDTIEENIRMGNKMAKKEEVIAAAKAAQCHDFIMQMEKGYDTLVGESGTYLSGGEAQRIALARAILKDAPIVLLDEATAYADPENEGKILESFSHLVQGKTVMVIAHRLSTIRNADQILVIDKGTVAERGKHDELIALDGLYSNMWNIYSRSRQWKLNR